MKVRFGFVAMSVILENASPSKTMTYASFSKLNDRQAAIGRLEQIAQQNLHSTLRLLKHAHGNDVKLYRLTSKLIPLATHDGLAGWDPYPILADDFKAVGDYALEKGIRVSLHPDHFCVLSTPRPEVLANSIKDLEYHVDMLEAMGLDERSKCNIHMGGAYGDKITSSARFIEQFSSLPDRLKHRITLENDDKTFNVEETLIAAEAVSVPMVLDIHHHAVNPGHITDEMLTEQFWPRIQGTWERELHRLKLSSLEQLPVKIHVSSPKSISDPRGHADLVEVAPVLKFLRAIASKASHVDCMLEAKSKDQAVFQLMDELKQLALTSDDISIIDDASIEIKTQ
ncbi:UV DNA damage repair endonuclease UvsE [Paenibacillus endoradicis]|uniref:UV DNA damage repair endonuclease UvsE n=1 Tax=Paenibacillus endoradicis TaxID=2972487 RepID=UPI0021595E9E|nr:UV DNA damage repair endonuclease UvsE [Paenibacillus endoradicis]MCR8660088.1 UV DNA damage repair endonuclease UvsE [Paenibacillus endoradicis]